MRRTFVIGDVHGHHDRLRTLIEQAGVSPDDEIVQLGDLGNFSKDTAWNDRVCYRMARDMKMTVLWGNHDRAAIDPWRHRFRGYSEPPDEMMRLITQVKPRLAHVAHGYLLTHAGLNPVWTRAWPDEVTADEALVRLCESYGLHASSGGLVDQIGKRRGGGFTDGGLLWRDDDEPLYMGVPQIYGHTKGDIRGRVQRLVPDETGGETPLYSLCIDIGSPDNGMLAGVWLPEGRIVVIGPEAADYNYINEVRTK